MPLTDIRIRQAKPQHRSYKLADAGGLYLLVGTTGSKLWRYKYRINGRENVFSIGSYPQISLIEARREHAAARDRVSAGEHPVRQRRDQKAADRFQAENTFGALAEEWYKGQIDADRWKPYYRKQIRAGLDKDLLPALGRLPIMSITPMQMLDVLRLVEGRGAPSVAINLRQWASAIFRLAVTTNRCKTDPAAPLKGVVLRPPTVHANAMGREGLGILMTRINGYGGNLTTRCGLALLAYTFVRTVEMRRAEWSEFDLEAGLWEIPATKMKKRRVHLVPLSRQAVQVIEMLRPLTGGGQFLFPNSRRSDDIMSATTINRALEHMGYASGQVSGHDFRATASTVLYEAGYREDLVEMQLAHVEEKKTRRAYNHAKYLAERREMLQWYADDVDASAAEQATLALRRQSRTEA